MGLRIKKSVKLPGGTRVNISKKGVGASWGVKGFRVAKDADGRKRTSVYIPGTGIGYTTSTSGKKKANSKSLAVKEESMDEEEIHVHSRKEWTHAECITHGIVATILTLFFLIMSLVTPWFLILAAVSLFLAIRDFMQAKNTPKSPKFKLK